MGLITLKTNTGIGTATGYSALASATNLIVRVRFQGAWLKNAATGRLMMRIHNGSNNKFEVFAYADGTSRGIQCIWRDSSQRYSEFSVPNTSLVNEEYYVLQSSYLSSDAGRTNSILYDASNTPLGAADELQWEGTLVTTGYTNLTIERNGTNIVYDGVAFWNAAPGIDPNTQPVDVGSLLGYHALAGNGANEVSGGPAFSFGGSSPGDWEYSAGGSWESWGGGPEPEPSNPDNAVNFGPNNPNQVVSGYGNIVRFTSAI